MTRRLALIGLGLVGLLSGFPPGPAPAQLPCPGLSRPLVAFAYESITVGATAIGFTATNISGAVAAAKVTVETATLRYRDDGTAPTASTGHQATPGDVLYVCGPSLGRFSMIATGATSAVTRVTYYRAG